VRACVTPGCCKTPKSLLGNKPVFVVILAYPFDWDDRVMYGPDRKPAWAVFGVDSPNAGASLTPCSYCPFCGQRLPEIQRRADPPAKVCVPDGEGYCLTCGKRLRECRCAWPEEQWEPV
jgi:hypothetical protein